jgi:hypothetical protein
VRSIQHDMCALRDGKTCTARPVRLRLGELPPKRSVVADCPLLIDSAGSTRFGSRRDGAHCSRSRRQVILIVGEQRGRFNRLSSESPAP